MMRNKIVILLVIIIFSLGLMGCVKTDEDWAIHNTKEFITSNLKAPTTAEFPSDEEFKVEHIKDNYYNITGYVDSENGFGAMVRMHYKVKMMVVEDMYYIQDAEILD